MFALCLGEKAGCFSVAGNAEFPPCFAVREHRVQAEAWLGMRPFVVSDRRALFDIAVDVAASTDRGEAIVAAMMPADRYAAFYNKVIAAIRPSWARQGPEHPCYRSC